MKRWLEYLGCFVWVIVGLALSAAAGWGTNDLFKSLLWLPNWANVVASVVTGLVTFVLIVCFSLWILTKGNKDNDLVGQPDFDDMMN